MKRLSVVLLLILFVYIFTLNVTAAQSYGFETYHLSDNEKNQIWEKFGITALINTDIKEYDEPIVCFDVSSSEDVVIGTENNNIFITDKNGEISHGYNFSNSGAYYVKWNNDTILVMLVRGSVIIEITKDGYLLNIIKTDTSDADNNRLWRQAKQNDVVVEGKSYVIRNKTRMLDLFTNSYSQLVKIDSLGNEYIIYDINTTQTLKTITILCFFIVFSVLIILLVVCSNQRGKKDQSGDGSMIEP